SASRAVMAEAAWPVGDTAQAATASRRAVTGLVLSMLRLSAASWRDRAMACCRSALAALRAAVAALWAAIPAAVRAVRVRASRPAITACRRRTARRWAWLLAWGKSRAVWLSGGWRAGSAPIRAAVLVAAASRVPL